MKTGSSEEILARAISGERKAHELRSQEKIEEAFNAYDEAASLYANVKEHLKSAMCYASAASCWNIRTGWQPLRNAATRNELAAEEAMKAKHYDYARSLFREAALLYEKEGDSEHYSVCFYESQIADAKKSWAIFTQKSEEARSTQEALWKDRLVAFARFALNIFGRVTWGYGERPFQTFALAAFIIVGSAFLYSVSDQILVEGVARSVSFWEALYLSVITYTTVGFGDYLPLGWTRIVAVHEGLAGIFLTPLFLIGLTRRYLRMYR